MIYSSGAGVEPFFLIVLPYPPLRFLDPTVIFMPNGILKLWNSNILIIFGGTRRTPELFSVGQFFFSLFFPTFFVKCRVKERERFRNASSYIAGQVVEEDDTR